MSSHNEQFDSREPFFNQVKKEWQTISEKYLEQYHQTTSRTQVQPVTIGGEAVIEPGEYHKLPLRDRVWLFMEDPNYSTGSKVGQIGEGGKEGFNRRVHTPLHGRSCILRHEKPRLIHSLRWTCHIL